MPFDVSDPISFIVGYVDLHWFAGDVWIVEKPAAAIDAMFSLIVSNDQHHACRIAPSAVFSVRSFASAFASYLWTVDVDEVVADAVVVPACASTADRTFAGAAENTMAAADSQARNLFRSKAFLIIKPPHKMSQSPSAGRHASSHCSLLGPFPVSLQLL